MTKHFSENAYGLVLCTLISLSLSFALFSGFVLTDGLSASVPAVLVLCALLTALCLAFSVRRAAVWAGLACAAAALAAAVIYMQQNAVLLSESENSLFLAGFLICCTALAVFLLSRSRAGCILLALAGCLIHACCGFLQFPDPLWAYLLFLPCAAILLLLRFAAVSVRRADLGTLGRGAYLLQCAVCAAVCLALACSVWAAVIRPLDPPTQELRLIELLRQMEPLQVLGVSQTHIVLDPNLPAPDTGEEETSDLAGDEQDESLAETEPTPSAAPESEQNGQTDQENAEAVTYDLPGRSRLPWLLLIPLAAAAAFTARYILLRRRRRAVAAMPNSEAVMACYPFFAVRLARCGMRCERGRTVREFAADIAPNVEPFDEGESSWANLTATYEKLFYGGIAPTDEERAQYERFYDRFYAALRREKGTLRYYLQCFRF